MFTLLFWLKQLLTSKLDSELATRIVS